jgi:hypothetical protein
MSHRPFDEAVVLLSELPPIDPEKLRAAAARVRARLQGDRSSEVPEAKGTGPSSSST